MLCYALLCFALVNARASGFLTLGMLVAPPEQGRRFCAHALSVPIDAMCERVVNKHLEEGGPAYWHSPNNSLARLIWQTIADVILTAGWNFLI